MQYREFGKTGKRISAISMGGMRFPKEDLDSEEGLERCVRLVEQAVSMGVNYFDIADHYAQSKCQYIYKKAFANIHTPVYTSSKSKSIVDKDADAVRRRIEISLENMGLDRITFFYMWCIMDREQYEFIMRKGGPYEGAMRAKEEGLIEHIVFSSHATADETAHFLSEGGYDGAIIPYSLMNYAYMQKVLDTAERNKLGIGVMNPLAGGVIPQNEEFFRTGYGIQEESVTDFALKFIYAHPAITTILSGISNSKQLEDNVHAIESMESDKKDYIRAVSGNAKNLSICTGCGYCLDGCPKKINIPAYMQAYNTLNLNTDIEGFGRTDKALLKDISVVEKLVGRYHELPDGNEPTCIRCGRCEEQCTQHLPIRERIEEVREIAVRAGATKSLRKERLQQAICGHGYRRIVFYTAGLNTEHVLKECRKYINMDEFEVIVADGNSQRWGGELAGYPIKSPQDMCEWKPDCVIISMYSIQEAIYKDLKEKYPELNVVKLYGEHDAPWVY